jgi:hypothetical protein
MEHVAKPAALPSQPEPHALGGEYPFAHLETRELVGPLGSVGAYRPPNGFRYSFSQGMVGTNPPSIRFKVLTWIRQMD